MSEERLNQLETTVSEHSQSIQGINVALNEITRTMQAFASGLVELRASQQAGFEELRASQRAVIETQRTTLESVDRLTNTVDNLAQTVDDLAQAVDVLVTQEVPSLNAAVERLDRIVDYILRRDGERS